MEFKFRRMMALFAVCLLVSELLSGLTPFDNQRAYAGTGGEIYTVAGNGDAGDDGDGEAAVDAELYYPNAIAIDRDDHLYIADFNNNKVRKVNAATGEIHTVAGTGSYNYSGDGDPAVLAQLSSPAGVAVDDDGNLYIADKYNSRIRKVGADGIITTVAGTGGFDYSGDDGPAVDAELRAPSGVAVDALGNLYIADTSNHRIRRVDAVTGIITTVAGMGYGTFDGDGGPAVDAELYYPSAVAIDSQGNLYIADTYNNRIRKVDTDGIISTVAGSSNTEGYDGDGGPAVEALLDDPEGVAVDGSGNLYIADTDNNRIRKVNTNGIIMTIAGTGTSGDSGEGVQGIYAQLSGPTGLALDSGGNLYIADYFNHRIRMQVPYIPSSDASLDQIALSSGTLSPVFATGRTDYTASVVNGVSSIRVTPTTTDSFMSVKVNDEWVESGTPSGDIDLDVGDNTITVVAVAEDGVTEQPYTIIVERLRSSNANLSQLTLSSGTLDPAFASNTQVYSATASQSEITVTPTLADALATVKVNGTPVENNTASQPIPLSLDSNNPIAVVVTAQSGATKDYTINVTRAISTNADLSGLSLSDGTLSSPFEPDTIEYAANVGNSVSSIRVTPTAADRMATVTVNGMPVDSGVASASLPLVVGSNTILLRVTAESGAAKDYTITVTRAESSNADLSDLTLSSGTLLPSFLPGTFKSSVEYAVSSVTVTPTVSDAVYATVEVRLYHDSDVLAVGPLPVASGAASSPLPLHVGSNTITIAVTAQDGTTKTYSVTVTRGASSNVDLSNLTLSGGTLIPAFAGTYTANVGHAVSSVTVTPTLADAGSASATASVYDGSGTLVSGPHAVASGAASPPLPLNVGNNVIEVLVTAQDGSTRTYKITVTRAESSRADLSGLTLSSGTLSPAFEPDTIRYTASVGNSVNTVTVTMEMSDAGRAAATASVYNGAGTLMSGPFVMSGGTAAFSLPLIVGSNEISILVKTQDDTMKTYEVDITRAASGTTPPGGGGGGGGSAAIASKPVIDLNGQTLDPAGLDAGKPFATLEATPTDGVATIGIPASVLTELAARNADFYLEIKVPYGRYQVPVNLALLMPGLPDLLVKNKLQAADVGFRITLTDKSGDQSRQAAIANALPNGTVLGPIVDFHIDIVHAKTGLTIAAADTFEKALTRWIPLPNNTTGLPKLWGAFRYHEAAQKLEFVPATRLKRDGVWYVAIQSHTNSAYVVAANTASFADVDGHWSKSAVELAAAKGLVEGVGGGRYAPDKTVTRAEFAAMLVRALGRGASAAGSAASYRDVGSDAWYSEAVAAAKEMGLLDFAGGGSFKPNQPLTREEMASMLAAMIAVNEAPIPKGWVSLDHYKDIETADDSYLEHIRLMVKLQIMTGTSEDTFSPKGATTRAQAAIVFIRMLHQLGMID